MSNVYISIVSYNGNLDTLNCLKSLETLTIKDFKLSVVVVDNASVDAFEVDAKDYENFELEIVRSDKNLGFSGGQNLGINHALDQGADYVVILNNDVTVDKELLLQLLKVLEEKSDCGLVSPKIYFSKGHEFHKDRYGKEDLGKVIWYAGGKMDWENVIGSHRGVDEVDRGQYDFLEKTDFTSGCCVMIKREVFEKIGFFDEKYFLYYEDNDLNQRAKQKGFSLYFQPKGFLWHLNAGSTGGSGSELHDYYLTRNRLMFGFKYASLRTKTALFRESLRTLLSGRKWQKTGVRDFYLGRFGKGSYA